MGKYKGLILGLLGGVFLFILWLIFGYTDCPPYIGLPILYGIVISIWIYTYIKSRKK